MQKMCFFLKLSALLPDLLKMKLLNYSYQNLQCFLYEVLKAVFVYRHSLVAGTYCWVTYVARATTWGMLGEMGIYLLNSVLAGFLPTFSNEIE